MAQARSLECAVVLHTEDPTPTTFAEFAAMAARAGLAPKYVVKHHSTPFTRPEDTSGLVPSILAKEELAAEALKGGPRFLLETDYIDDPRRPGAVLGPTTVPKFMSANPMSISPTALRSRGSNPASIRCQRLRRTSMLRLSASDGRENR